MRIFSVRDAKVEAFMQPFFVRHVGEAIRGFEGLVNDGTTNVAKYPMDFDLFELGEFDELLGKIKAHDAPKHIASAWGLLSNKGEASLEKKAIVGATKGISQVEETRSMN